MESRTVITTSMQPGIDNDALMRCTAYFIAICCPEDAVSYSLSELQVDYLNPYDQNTKQHGRAEMNIKKRSHKCTYVALLEGDSKNICIALSDAFAYIHKEKIRNVIVLREEVMAGLVTKLVDEFLDFNVKEVARERRVESIKTIDIQEFEGKHVLCN